MHKQSDPAPRRSLRAPERSDLLRALQAPRGRYGVGRAAQLSGVPERTIYHWASKQILVPDFSTERPKGWSYRDLMYLRLTAWLRAKNVALPDAAQVVGYFKSLISSGEEVIETRVSTAGAGLAIGPTMAVDAITGQQVFETMVDQVKTFDLLTPVEDFGSDHLWGPNLIWPSARTAISPWVMSGEPVVRNSRVTTSALFMLQSARGLEVEDIARLYPGVTTASVADAISLEERLRKVA